MATSPNPNTAYILNNLIIALQEKLQQEVDIALSSEEFALGQPQAVRPIDLCFGLDPIIGTNPMEEIVLARGLARDNTLGLVTLSSVTISPSSSLPDIPIENCYAFGSIFLEGGGNVNYYLAQGDDETPVPLVVNQDVSTDQINDSLQVLGTPPGVSTGSTPIEIIRFVLVIDLYNPTVTPVQKQVTVLLNDLRRIRGWAGFCEETMANILTPPLINVSTNTGLEYGLLNIAVYSLVSTWVHLGWQPNFNTFWTTDGNTLPAALSSYISTYALGNP